MHAITAPMHTVYNASFRVVYVRVMVVAEITAGNVQRGKVCTVAQIIVLAEMTTIVTCLYANIVG